MMAARSSAQPDETLEGYDTPPWPPRVAGCCQAAPAGLGREYDHGRRTSELSVSTIHDHHAPRRGRLVGQGPRGRERCRRRPTRLGRPVDKSSGGQSRRRGLLRPREGGIGQRRRVRTESTRPYEGYRLRTRLRPRIDPVREMTAESGVSFTWHRSPLPRAGDRGDAFARPPGQLAQDTRTA